MALPLYFPIRENIIDGYIDSNIPISKPASTKKNNFGGATFEHYLLPNGAGGTVVISNHTDGDNIYTSYDNVVPHMALLYNANGGVVTPNYGDAINNIEQPFNFAGIALTATSSIADSWDIQSIIESAPMPRASAAMVFDLNTNRSTLFGGGYSLATGSALNDTWEWNGIQWINKKPLLSPSARTGHAMAYDSGRGKIVLYGGQDNSGVTSADTWEWDGTNWANIFHGSPSLPGALNFTALAYDVKNANTLLFGGNNGSSVTQATWTWDGVVWTQHLGLMPQPPARQGHVMAYDSIRNRVVLFGGQGADSNTYYADTWEWDGSGWTEIITNNINPSPRSLSTMVFNSTGKVMVLFGGIVIEQAKTFNDTWLFDGTTWTLENIPGPAKRAFHTMSYDVTKNKTVLFGGLDLTITSIFDIKGDTWQLGHSSLPLLVQTAGDGYVYYDASPGRAIPIIGDFLGPSAVSGTITPAVVSPIFGTAADSPIIDPKTSAPLQLIINNSPVGIVKMKLGAFYGFIPSIAPAITDFIPNHGIVGEKIIVDGYAFVGTTQVNVNGPTTTFSIISNTQLSFLVPAAAQDTGNIVITNTIGVISLGTFTTNPTIQSVTSIIVADIGQVTRGGSIVAVTTTAPHNFMSGDNISVISIDVNFPSGSFTVTVGGLRTFSYSLSGSAVSNTSTITFIDLTTPVGPNHAIGSSIQILGHTFSSASAINFNGTNQPTFIIADDTKIYTTVPSGATTGPIVVTTPGGTASYQFIVSPPPIINTFSPSSGATNNTVIITGSGFLVPGASFDGYGVVQFKPIPSGTTLTATRTIFSDLSMSINVPSTSAGPAIPYNIIISTNGGVVNSSQTAIANIGNVSRTPFSVLVITNAPHNFTSGDLIMVKTTDSVNFPLGNYVISVISSTIFGYSDSGSGIHTSTTVFTFYDLTNAFTIVSPPTFTLADSFVPTSGHIGNVISIHGQYGFTGTTTVFFGDYQSPTITNLNDTHITAVVPATPNIVDASVPIIIVSPGGTTASTDSFAAGSGPINSPTEFSISLQPNLYSYMAIANIGSVSRVSSIVTAITTSVHNFTAGDSIVVVSTDSNYASGTFTILLVTGPSSFTYSQGGSGVNSIASIIFYDVSNSFSPLSAAANDVIHITGDTFAAVDQVYFTNTAPPGPIATFTVKDNTHIDVIVPATSSGIINGPITVKSKLLTVDSHDSFTYFLGPTGTADKSSGGYGFIPTTVTITGTNLKNSDSTIPLITFGGVLATVLSGSSSTSVAFTVPVGARDGIVLQTDGGVLNITFSVVQPPIIYYTTPTQGTLRFGGTTVTIRGINFVNGMLATGIFLRSISNVTTQITTPAPIISNTQITFQATTPVLSKGNYSIKVRVVYGTGSEYYDVVSPQTFLALTT